MRGQLPFNSLYRHGFIRAAVAIPEVFTAQPPRNAARVIELASLAAERSAAIVVFPELGLSGYSCEDLFGQQPLLESCQRELNRIVEASRNLAPLLLVGLPLAIAGRLFNVAVVIAHGQIIAVVPKTYLPNHREFYEKRQFVSGADATFSDVNILGRTVPFGTDLLLQAADLPAFTLGVELCEDLWVPLPPSTLLALGGATVLCNLSASNVTIGKAEYRRQLCSSHSARCLAAYIYSAAGAGESTTDLAWDGHGLICENGSRLAETERFSPNESLITADIDLERLTLERQRMTSFQDCAARCRQQVSGLRRVSFQFNPPEREVALERVVDRFPYVPNRGPDLDDRCAEAFQIQVSALHQRFRTTGSPHAIIGVSGGLDSTLALLVCARTFDRLRKPRSEIIAVTMPGYATSDRTLANARSLMTHLGVTQMEIDIKPSSRLLLANIDHPYAHGRPVYDVTFENVQAGERTSHLFRLANLKNGLVIGTGDLSEIALGWCTYGVGDHMSHYNVNSSVPKTLVQHLIRWVIRTAGLGEAADAVLESILSTEISPELVPLEGASGQPGQRSEDKIGPYELQDFHLYYLSRFGFRPSKVAWLALQAWGDPARGAWPDGIAGAGARGYDLPAIKKWLVVFLERFFQYSQFKRSCMPNGPKVGSGGSLSPRGDWRAPSDVSAALWLNELRENTP